MLPIFLPFLSQLPNIIDTDAAWALKSEIPVDESEDPYSISEGEEETLVIETESPSTSRSLVARLNDNFPSAASVRERKSSLPLSAKIFIPVNSSHSQGDAQDIPPKDLLNKLRSNAQTLANFDCSAIAEEITRVELKLFMDIEVSISYYNAIAMIMTTFCSHGTGCNIPSCPDAKTLSRTQYLDLMLFPITLLIGKSP
jgi:hypothetical protein